VLRIHFTAEDLAKVRVAAAPDPLWETIFSLYRLRGGDGAAFFAAWRRQAAGRVSRPALEMLLPLVPGGFYPDFLTPAEGEQGIDAGIEAVLSTPRARLRADVETVGERWPLPSWARSLADGEVGTLERLGRALRAHHRTVIEPCWTEARAHVEADRARRARAVLDGGCDALLHSFRPMMRWNSPVLEADVTYEQDLHLDGRGLVLVPSYLSWRTPDVLRDPALPPVLVYPVERITAPGVPAAGGAPESLAALLGHTRAAVLETVGDGCTTTELARRVGISAGSVSQHTAVLRDAGLILTGRHGKSVMHTLTPLGRAMLGPAGAPAAPRLRGDAPAVSR
jgi:DNA-binding transcriptional ArsR family regulator